LPNILVHIPKHCFPGAARGALVQRINDAAAEAGTLQHLVGAAHGA
jgi:hypothetical protein